MADTQQLSVAVVVGVGPGLGAALVRRFAPAYAIAMLARKMEYLQALAGELRHTGATVLDLRCDVSDHAQITEAFRAIRTDLGDPAVLLYNAGSGTFGTIAELTPEQYEADWRVYDPGGLVAGRQVARRMSPRRGGDKVLSVSN